MFEDHQDLVRYITPMSVLPAEKKFFSYRQDDAPGEATKFDGEKAPISLIPRSAIEAEARVMAYGAKKYGKNNWRKGNGMDFTRVGDAALRHLLAWLDGEDTDPETGENHLAHLRCNAAFLIEYQAAGIGTDDRHKKGN